jgi:hypothetical protein
MDQRRCSLGHAQYPRGEADMGALRGPHRLNGERETEEMRRWLPRGENHFPGLHDEKSRPFPLQARLGHGNTPREKEIACQRDGSYTLISMSRKGRAGMALRQSRFGSVRQSVAACSTDILSVGRSVRAILQSPKRNRVEGRSEFHRPRQALFGSVGTNKLQLDRAFSPSSDSAPQQ